MKNRIRQLAKKISELEKKLRPRELPDLVIAVDGGEVLIFKPGKPTWLAF